MSDTNAKPRIQTNEKLAIFLPNLDGGGAERIVLNLAEGMVKLGYNVDLVLAQADGPYRKSVSSALNIVDLGQGKLVKRFKTIQRLPALVRYLRQKKPAVLLAALTEANVVALCASLIARHPGRVIVSEHNTMSQIVGKHATGMRRLYPLFARFTYRYADNIIGVSQGVVDDLIQNIGIPAKNALVLFNPVITDQVKTNAKKPVDHPWFDADQPPVILSVGRLHVQKDYGTLLQAFKKLRESQPARLIILGEGDERQSLEAQVKQLDIASDVSLPGFVNNPHAYMANAAVYVLSSRWEGLPTVLIEALYCGPPIVSTDCPSGPHEILKGGELGCLVPMQNPDALALGIQQALEGNCPRANDDSWREYDPDIIIKKYIDLLFDDNRDKIQ